MEVQIIIFGQLTDIFKTGELRFRGAGDTNELIRELNKRYPALANARFTIAVNKQTVTGNTNLQEGSTVALMPPFSGG